MKCNQSRPGFERMSPCPYPTTITSTPRAPPLWRLITNHVVISFENTRRATTKNKRRRRENDNSLPLNFDKKFSCSCIELISLLRLGLVSYERARLSIQVNCQNISISSYLVQSNSSNSNKPVQYKIVYAQLNAKTDLF